MPLDLPTALRAGPQSAAQLRDRLGASQPTLSRALTRARSEIAHFGRGRATRYALYRRIRELAPEFPVHRVTMSGDTARIGTLVTIAPDRYWYDDLEQPSASAEHQSLPFFATDMRPQGYLGRFFPQMYADLGLPDRITDWNEDQALYAMARRGDDTVGNLLIGEESFARWIASTTSSVIVTEAERLAHYRARTEEAIAGRPAGSSAAGEQPKFTAVVGATAGSVRHVLVKFSSSLASAGGRRWADMLLAEHLASEVLLDHEHAAARTHFLIDGTRAYLEVERFDRTGLRGRVGLVSLGALDDEFVGERRGWSESAGALLRARLINARDARELRYLSAFGALIANTDMHLGNASFLTEGYLHFRLAPSYDMLPMMYAPTRDEVPERQFILPTPRPAHSDQWIAALPAAHAFWQRLAADSRASPPFREIANANAISLDQARR
ncbi:MAG: type II toxin-antitoxin system HipA family toxin YjjJ [Gammaproteobacteria bacterium]